MQLLCCLSAAVLVECICSVTPYVALIPQPKLGPQGNIHVAAYTSHTVKVFTKEGVYIRMYGGPDVPLE